MTGMEMKHLDYSVTELDFKDNSSRKERDKILHLLKSLVKKSSGFHSM